MPVRPLLMTGLSMRPACSRASSVARVERSETRPIERMRLPGVVVGKREVGDRSAELGVEPLDVVPFMHAANRVFAGEKPRLDRFPILAERRDAAHAGDDDSAHQIMPPLTLMTWRVT